MKSIGSMAHSASKDASASDKTEASSDVTAPFSPRALTGLVPSGVELLGTSGVYLLKNSDGQNVAVFKPMDEEKFPEEASKWAVVPGTGQFRERAAFVVSNELGGFSGVPNTIITTIDFKGSLKKGSLQRYVPLATDMSDMGPADIPVEQVHKIGALDILLFNMDRHEGNLLLRSSSGINGPSRELVPIDHGLSLPVIVDRTTGPNREVLDDLYFAWQTWPQARQPFGKDALQTLKNLTMDAVASMVQTLRDDLENQTLMLPALTTLKVGAMLLRTCAIANMNLHDISMFVRQMLKDCLEAAWLSADQNTEEISDGEGQLVSTVETDIDIEERLYNAWEARLLAELQKQLQRVLKPADNLSSTGVETAGRVESKVKVLELTEGQQPGSPGAAIPSSSEPGLSSMRKALEESITAQTDSCSERAAPSVCIPPHSSRFEQLSSPLNSPKPSPTTTPLKPAKKPEKLSLEADATERYFCADAATGDSRNLHSIPAARMQGAHHPIKRGAASKATSHLPPVFLGKDLHPLPRSV